GGELVLAEAHQSAKGELQEPLALAAQPFAPALLGDSNVVDEGTAVELSRGTQPIAAALADQGLEPADIAQDCRGIERYDLTVALERVLAERFAQAEQGLAQ